MKTVITSFTDISEPRHEYLDHLRRKKIPYSIKFHIDEFLITIGFTDDEWEK
jgi:hypothetical protein